MFIENKHNDIRERQNPDWVTWGVLTLCLVCADEKDARSNTVKHVFLWRTQMIKSTAAKQP